MFEWEYFISTAERLAEVACDTNRPFAEREADARSAVSRAYYALFNVCLEWAEEEGLYTSRGDGNDHTRLRSSIAHTNRSLADKLQRLRMWRNGCDYEPDGEWQARAVIAIGVARSGNEFIRNFHSG